MTLVVELPDVSGVPVWAWVAAGVAAWYVFAAAVVRFAPDRVGLFVEGGPEERLFVWALSPAVLPVELLVSAALWFGRVFLTPRRRRGPP